MSDGARQTLGRRAEDQRDLTAELESAMDELAFYKAENAILLARLAKTDERLEKLYKAMGVEQ